MIALSMILVVSIWALVSFFIARMIARLLPGWWPQLIALTLIFAMLMVAPIADELIGKRQFEQLCQDLEHEGVKYYGKVELGPEFYFEDGTPKWVAMNYSLDEYNRADRFVKEKLGTVIRTGEISIEEIGHAMPIQKLHRSFRDAITGQRLAEEVWYGTHGGRISRGLEAPLFIEAQCMKNISSDEIYKQITRPKNTKGERK